MTRVGMPAHREQGVQGVHTPRSLATTCGLHVATPAWSRSVGGTHPVAGIPWRLTDRTARPRRWPSTARCSCPRRSSGQRLHLRHVPVKIIVRASTNTRTDEQTRTQVRYTLSSSQRQAEVRHERAEVAGQRGVRTSNAHEHGSASAELPLASAPSAAHAADPHQSQWYLHLQPSSPPPATAQQTDPSAASGTDLWA
jgi:hypothetical protein